VSVCLKDIMSCSIHVEDTFGPTVASGCYHGFDFTLLFEEVILGIVPLAIVLTCLVPFRILHLAKCRENIRGGWLHHVKLVCMDTSSQREESTDHLLTWGL
jgi:ATP-binding cassette, subfamily C (CFTR/MRP), member 1